jgi:hypothetical protein
VVGLCWRRCVGWNCVPVLPVAVCHAGHAVRAIGVGDGCSCLGRVGRWGPLPDIMGSMWVETRLARGVKVPVDSRLVPSRISQHRQARRTRFDVDWGVAETERVKFAASEEKASRPHINNNALRFDIIGRDLAVIHAQTQTSVPRSAEEGDEPAAAFLYRRILTASTPTLAGFTRRCPSSPPARLFFPPTSDRPQQTRRAIPLLTPIATILLQQR